MTVPYTFASQTGFIPLSQLDANFASIPDYANNAGNITGNVQSNITGLGTLTSLSVSGTANITGIANVTGSLTVGSLLTSGQISTAGNITANFVLGNGSALTGVTVASLPALNLTGTTLSSNVLNSSLTSLGVLSSLSVSGNIISGNVSGTTFTGNLVGQVNGNVTGNLNGNVTGNLTGNVNGNVTGNLTGTASVATTANSVDGANVSGTVATAAYAASAGTTVTASSVTGNAQGNITSVGTLTDLTVTGNITSSTGYFLGNGSLLSGISANYGNANVANYLPTFSGQLTAGNISATGNITATYFVGDGGNITNLPLGNYGNSNVAAYISTYTGNVSAGNVLTDNYLFANGTPVSFSSAYGNANVAAYLPTYTGNIGAGNVLTTNIQTDNYLYANGVPVTGLGANVSSNSVVYTAPFSGGTTITGTSKWSQFVSVLDFGADPTGSADSRNAFQAALNTGKHVYIPTGNYRINSRLQMLNTGQMMSGDGRDASVLRIDSSFNLADVAVIDCSNIQPGVVLRDFGITFTQPDTSSRGSLTAYPVVIKATDAPRTTIQDLKIQGAIDGIDLTGNSGGAFIELLEMSAFGTGIEIDGSLDTIRINKFHFWPFNLTSNQQQIFYSSGTQGMQIGRVDGLFINEYLNISWLGMTLTSTVSGDPWVYIENSGFDTYNGIVHNGGSLQVTNSYITVLQQNNVNGYIMGGTNTWAQFTNCRFLAGSPNQSMILMQNCNACTLAITQGHFEGPMPGIPYIFVGSTVLSQSSLQVTDSIFQIKNQNSYVVNAVGPSSGSVNMHFVNNIVQTAPNTSFSNAMFRFGGGNRIYMSGNRVWDKGSNTANFISVAVDDWNWISGNMAPGWTMQFPSAVLGFYSNNLNS